MRDKENQISAQKLEMSNKDAQIIKLEKSLFSIIEEVWIFFIRIKISNLRKIVEFVQDEIEAIKW